MVSILCEIKDDNVYAPINMLLMASGGVSQCRNFDLKTMHKDMNFALKMYESVASTIGFLLTCILMTMFCLTRKILTIYLPIVDSLTKYSCSYYTDMG